MTRPPRKRAGRNTAPSSEHLPLRITLLRPPRDVRISVQRGKTNVADLVPPSSVNDDAVTFDLQVRVDIEGSSINFLGEFAQGPRDGRFVYVNSGTLAGDPNSRWSRRLKVSLMDITVRQARAVLAQPGTTLEAQLPGMARDGGPSCATVPFIRTWHQVAL